MDFALAVKLITEAVAAINIAAAILPMDCALAVNLITEAVAAINTTHTRVLARYVEGALLGVVDRPRDSLFGRHLCIRLEMIE
jgi:hypothetical protein